VKLSIVLMFGFRSAQNTFVSFVVRRVESANLKATNQSRLLRIQVDTRRHHADATGENRTLEDELASLVTMPNLDSAIFERHLRWPQETEIRRLATIKEDMVAV